MFEHTFELCACAEKVKHCKQNDCMAATKSVLNLMSCPIAQRHYTIEPPPQHIAPLNILYTHAFQLEIPPHLYTSLNNNTWHYTELELNVTDSMPMFLSCTGCIYVLWFLFCVGIQLRLLKVRWAKEAVSYVYIRSCWTGHCCHGFLCRLHSDNCYYC